MWKPLIALIAVVLAGTLSSQAFGATRNVSLGDDWFVRDGKPTTVTVSRGDTVRWRWTGRNPHNVQVQRGPRRAKFQSKVKRSGTYSRALSKSGTYRIVCSIHAPDMRMTLVVD
jgi:plastocyanin